MDEAEIDRLEARGMASLEAGDLAGALDCLRTVIGVRRTGQVIAALRRLASSAFKRGTGQMAGQGTPAEAYRQCVEAYTIIGEAIDTHQDREILRVACFNLGAIHQRAGAFQEAITYYRDALLLQPSESGAAINLGTLLTSVGRGAEAVPILREAMARQPESRGIHRNLINALYESGDTGGAVVATQEAAQRFPDMRFQHRVAFYPTKRLALSA